MLDQLRLTSWVQPFNERELSIYEGFTTTVEVEDW